MANTREYRSPDGSLRFEVLTEDDGDVLLGFRGFEWHTHADLLAADFGVSEAEAVEKFVQKLLNSQSVIAISRVGGEIKDICITYDPESETQGLADGVSVELRLWDGRTWSAA